MRPTASVPVARDRPGGDGASGDADRALEVRRGCRRACAASLVAGERRPGSPGWHDYVPPRDARPGSRPRRHRPRRWPAPPTSHDDRHRPGAPAAVRHRSAVAPIADAVRGPVERGRTGRGRARDGGQCPPRRRWLAASLSVDGSLESAGRRVAAGSSRRLDERGRRAADAAVALMMIGRSMRIGRDHGVVSSSSLASPSASAEARACVRIMPSGTMSRRPWALDVGPRRAVLQVLDDLGSTSCSRRRERPLLTLW